MQFLWLLSADVLELPKKPSCSWSNGCNIVDTAIPLFRADSTWDSLLHLYFVTCLLLGWLKPFHYQTWWKLWQPRESQEQKGRGQCQGVLVWCHISAAKFYFVLIPCTSGSRGTSNRSKLFVIPPKSSPCPLHNGFAGPSPSVSFSRSANTAWLLAGCLPSAWALSSPFVSLYKLSPVRHWESATKS